MRSDLPPGIGQLSRRRQLLRAAGSVAVSAVILGLPASILGVPAAAADTDRLLIGLAVGFEVQETAAAPDIVAAATTSPGSETATRRRLEPLAPLPVQFPAGIFAPPIAGEERTVRTTEYLASGSADRPGHDAIGATDAYRRGITGEGVTVAVIDTGIDSANPEFTGQMATGTDLVEGGAGGIDRSGHGTHVAGIIGAARNGQGTHGVAYGAKLRSIRAFSDQGTLPGGTASLAQALRTAARDPIINLSIGMTTAINELRSEDFPADLLVAAQDAARAGSVMVWAAGNGGGDQVSATAGMPLLAPDDTTLQAHTVAVVAYDTARRDLAAFSNACGIAKTFCVAAPGTEVRSTGADGGVTTLSGTSQAAPQVSGALALLIQAFPGLTAAQALQVLFLTAEDVGDSGVDEVFGWGLIDVEAALSTPVGSLTLPTGTDVAAGGVAIDDLGFGSTGAIGDGIRTMLAGQSLMVLDAFERGFQVDLDAFAEVAARAFDVEAALMRFGTGNGVRRIALGEEEHLEIRFRRPTPDRADFLAEPESPLAADVDLRYISEAAGWSAGIHWGGEAGLGLARTTDSLPVEEDAVIQTSAFANPFLSELGRAAGASFSTRAADWQGGRVTGHIAGYAGLPEDEADDPFTGRLAETESGDRFAGVGVVALDLGQHFKLRANVGALVERDAVLGSRFSGAAGSVETTRTAFAGLSGEIDLPGNLALYARVDVGVSEAEVGGGLIQGMDRVTTTGFGVGLAGHDLFREGDGWGVAVSQPLRAESGSVRLKLPVGRDETGRIGYRESRSEIEPSARTLDVQGFYRAQISDDVTASAGVLQRFSPGHSDDGRDETLGLIRLHRRF